MLRLISLRGVDREYNCLEQDFWFLPTGTTKKDHATGKYRITMSEDKSLFDDGEVKVFTCFKEDKDGKARWWYFTVEAVLGLTAIDKAITVTSQQAEFVLVTPYGEFTFKGSHVVGAEHRLNFWKIS
jgi:hypothetical protein